MKIVIAQMKHETNTFSPVSTPLTRFAVGDDGVPLEGPAAIAAMQGTGSSFAAFLDLARETGAEIVVPIVAEAAPSGPVDDAAYEYIVGRICDTVRQGCDAILLDLHGAMVTRQFDDGEGELLRRLRIIAPATPIGVALDMHTNLSQTMAEYATVIAGYQTYPHVDMYETGMRAGRSILALLGRAARPIVAWGSRPMLPHVMRQGTDDAPNRELQARCRAMESQGALAASVFVGFPHADIPFAGLSAVVVTDDDAALARQYCDELLDNAWREREQFVYRPELLSESLVAAQAASLVPGEGPVVLLDHYDNCASGGTMDSMAVLGAMLDAGLDNAAAFAIYDPSAVEMMAQAGVGATVTLALGGKLDMPSIGVRGTPRTVSGRIKLLCDGHFRNRGPMSTGQRMNMGRSGVLDTGKIEIAVISRHQEPFDIACLIALGIDPMTKRFLMLKSRVHWRAGLRHYAKAVVECAGVGVCTSDYSTLQFKRVRRPIYPLDGLVAP